MLCLPFESSAEPAGLCYQRLAIDSQASSFCLHGLNAVWLTDYGWYRVDPRGNREGVDCQFDPPTEKLAFAADGEGEYNLPDLYVRPLPVVVACLATHDDWADVYEALPDMQATREAGQPNRNLDKKSPP